MARLVKNEILDRAYAFVESWKDETREHAEAKSFWDAFFNVFGVERRRLASFEEPAKKFSGKGGFIDLFWPGTLLVEHKSLGEDLVAAYSQAVDYFAGLSDEELPRYVMVSDFKTIRLYDLDKGDKFIEFKITELPNKIQLFYFISGYQERVIREEDPVNVKAAQMMGKLHDQLKDAGFRGHPLEVFLVRTVFCLFADDAQIFEKDAFYQYLLNYTSEDGSDTGTKLNHLFQVLDQTIDSREEHLNEDLKSFPYIDGGLFKETLPSPSFSSSMRKLLLDSAELNWSQVSPAIFGSLFQSIMDPAKRRELGAHYTSERNILKAIKPLFLDELAEELHEASGNKRKLEQFHDKLANIKILDPACGCGNFLVVSYRELRLLEIEVLKKLKAQGTGQIQSSIFDIGHLIKVDIDQMYGIEIEEFPALVAELALWLTDHQMNLVLSDTFGQYFARIPLTKSANILKQANALTTKWDDLLPVNQCTYIVGNPPFTGAKLMTETQRQELLDVAGDISSPGLLDYVAGWYFKAEQYIDNYPIRCALVSTNSISQGEQVGVLWQPLLDRGISIDFAHRTFKWSNEGKKKAAVHCVIIGFSRKNTKPKRLFYYKNADGEPYEKQADNINPYLVDAENTLVFRRRTPISDAPKIGIGNKPIDGGFYLFTPEEKAAFVKQEPLSEKYFKKWIGSKEFINNIERWCLWVGEAEPTELKGLTHVLDRIRKVRDYRLSSKSKPTRHLARRPRRFHVENIPKSSYLVIPKVSSERREYLPIGYMSSETLAGDAVFVVQNANQYHFGVLNSKMHNVWTRYVAGRLESRLRYSKDVVYNNFPWPEDIGTAAKDKVESLSEDILKARTSRSSNSLADLYDPDLMPDNLRAAHSKLDAYVDSLYTTKKFENDLDRIKALFDLYKKLDISKKKR